MNSPATDVAAHLQAGGIGNVAGPGDWPIYIGDEPDAPPNCITVYDTGGPRLLPDQEIYENTIQIRIRAVAYGAGYDKISAARDWLVIPKSVVIGDWHYIGFWLMSDIAPIGRDQQNRHLMVCNIRLIREPAT